MVEIASDYAVHLGQLVLNLTSRGFMVKLQSRKNLFNNDVMQMQVHDLKRKKVVEHMITEAEMAQINDVSVIADVISTRIKE